MRSSLCFSACLFLVVLTANPWSVHASTGSFGLVRGGGGSSMGTNIGGLGNGNSPRVPSFYGKQQEQQQRQQLPSTGSPIQLAQPQGFDETNPAFPALTRRGGQDADSFVKAVGTITDGLIACGRTVLPPTVAFVKGVVGFYKALPRDAVIAQVGLVYCFAGGYYPTLFSSLQAARLCGWEVAVKAIDELACEAIKVIDASSGIMKKVNTRRELVMTQTSIVLKTVDPMKINEAAAALYTTWLGVSAVLEKEYARVISLSLTLSRSIERLAHYVIGAPIKLCISEEYHKWVPVVIGWGCKAIAINLAWRVQRVLTAGTSALTGGLMFSRALLRMLSKRGIRFFGIAQNLQPGGSTPWEPTSSKLDEVIGFLVGGLGLYTQIESQYRSGFSFQVPFPINLVTWPFDLAENWIQWQITKE